MLYNRQRALDLMRENNLTAIIGTTLENVTYLTGHVGWAQRVYRPLQSYAVMTAEENAGTDLILTRSDNTYYAAFGSYAERVYSYGGRVVTLFPDDFTPSNDEERRFLDVTESAARYKTIEEALLAALNARGISKGRIAVDEEGCPPSLFGQLKENLPGCEFLPASGLFLLIRLVKSEEELERLKAAAQVNENAIEKVFAFIQPGVTENEVAQIWRESVAREGGMWHWFHFNSGRRSASIFPPTSRKMQKGDLFMFDAGHYLNNYNADTGSCGCLGEPNEKAKKEWKAIETGFFEALNVIKEGCTGQQIYRALKDGIQKAGMPEFNSPFAGHTIGLEAREFPFILSEEVKYNLPFIPQSSEISIPANAVLNIEAPIGTMGFGGYQIEYSVIVTKNGWKPLIKQDRHFRILG